MEVDENNPLNDQRDEAALHHEEAALVHGEAELQSDEVALRMVSRPCPLCSASIELPEINGSQEVTCLSCGLTCSMDVSPEIEVEPVEESPLQTPIPADHISRWLAGEPINECKKTSFRQQLFQRIQRHRLVAAFASTVVAALFFGSLTLSWRYFEAAEILAQRDEIEDNHSHVVNKSVASLRRSFQTVEEKYLQAKRQREIAERETRKMTAKYLAMRSQSFLKRDPQYSALLALKAVHVTMRRNEQLVSDAHQNLRDMLASEHDGFRLEGHTDKITSLSVSPDGRWLASGSFDNTVRLWDLFKAAPKATSITLKQHKDQVSDLLFSKDNHWLVTGSLDTSICLWDIQTGKPLAFPIVLQNKPGQVNFLAMSPNGRWLVTCGNAPEGPKNSIVRLWDLSNGASEATSFELKGHASPVHTVSISPNSRWLVLGVKETVQLWDLKSRSPTATSLVLLGHTGAISKAVFTNDNRWLITSDKNGNAKNSIARLWDLTARDPSSSIVLQGHTASIQSMAISHDSRWLATAGNDQTMRVWDLKSKDPTAKPIVRHQDSDEICEVAISPDNRWLTAGGTDGKLYFWGLTDQGPDKMPVVLNIGAGNLDTMVISPDSRWLAAAGKDQSIHLWNLKVEDLLSHVERIAAVHDLPASNPSELPSLAKTSPANASPAVISQVRRPHWWSDLLPDDWSQTGAHEPQSIENQIVAGLEKLRNSLTGTPPAPTPPAPTPPSSAQKLPDNRLRFK